jgi:integrase
MKNVLRKSKIDNFSAHSFRSASSTAMLDSGVPIDEVLRSAGWSNANTFYKFYYRPAAAQCKKDNGKPTQRSLLSYFQQKKKD